MDCSSKFIKPVCQTRHGEPRYRHSSSNTKANNKSMCHTRRGLFCGRSTLCNSCVVTLNLDCLPVNGTFSLSWGLSKFVTSESNAILVNVDAEVSE